MISTNSISGNIKLLTDCLSVKLQKSVARLLLLSLLLLLSDHFTGGGRCCSWFSASRAGLSTPSSDWLTLCLSVYSYLSLHDTQQTRCAARKYNQPNGSLQQMLGLVSANFAPLFIILRQSISQSKPWTRPCVFQRRCEWIHIIEIKLSRWDHQLTIKTRSNQPQWNLLYHHPKIFHSHYS